MATLTVRASSMPAATRCIHCMDMPDIHIEQVNDAQLDGTYVHPMLAEHVMGKPIPEAPNKNTQILFYQGVKLWSGLAIYFPDPMTEQELSADYPGLKLTGHADVASIIEHNGKIDARILDWKSGRVKSDYRAQLLSYALMIADALRADSVTIITGWLRDGEYETERFTALELSEERARLIANLTNPDAPYCTGSHCKHCRMQHECPAHQQLTATAALALTGHPDIDLRAIQGERLGNLRAQRDLMKSALDALDTAERLEIMAGGPLNIGNGMQIDLKPQGRRHVNSKEAINILMPIYGDKLLNYVSIGTGAVDKLVMDNAERGKKKAEKEWVNKLLDDAGAYEVSHFYKIVEGKKEIEQ